MLQDKILKELDELITKTNEDRRYHLQNRHYVEACAAALKLEAYDHARIIICRNFQGTRPMESTDDKG